MFEDIKNVNPLVLGILLAIFIAVIRVIYDREETSAIRVLLESVLCGALALIAGTAINALGLSQDWTLFAGGMIGFMGSQSIRVYANLLIKSKVNDSSEK